MAKFEISEQKAYYLYDWAISGFTLIILTVFLNPYLTSVAKANADCNGFISIFGIKIFAESLFEYSISLSVFLQALILPFISAKIDYTRNKKKYLLLFTIIGSTITLAMFSITEGMYKLGSLLILVSNVCYGSSLVIYNAFLTDVSTEEERDRVSSLGYAWGYIGGGLLLAFDLLVFIFYKELGISSEKMAIRITFVSAAIWWGFFGLISILNLRKRHHKPDTSRNIFKYYQIFFRTVKDSINYPQALTFLIAYLLYNDGVQTIVIIAGKFGIEELGISLRNITLIILIIQFVAFFGAKLFFSFSKKIGSLNSLGIALIVWLIVVLYSYLFLTTHFEFYILCVFIAIVLGGTQALSRSIYSKLIPLEKETEYFSMYELTERGTSWLGTLVFGLSLQITGSYHLAMLPLALFFLGGIILLIILKFRFKY